MIGRIVIVVASLGAVAAATVFAVGGSSDADSAADDESVVTTATAEVTRRTLSESAEINGLVSHGTARVLPIEPEGVVTMAPSPGDEIGPGSPIVHVNDDPVIVVEGDVPLYRTLRLVPSSERDDGGDKVGLLEGDDVLALEQFLNFLGFDDDGDLDVDGKFDRSTRDAVKDWQESVGLARTGEVDRSQVVFLDGPVRIEKSPQVGDTFSADALTVTQPSETVTARATTRQQSFFRPGTQVTIPADGGDVAGTVSTATRTVSDDGSTSFELEIEVPVDALSPDVETVRVASEKIVADDVLTVPASALLALAEGGWAVNVVDDAGSTLTRVELGAVVDGVAEVSGVTEGAQVVVPS